MKCGAAEEGRGSGAIAGTVPVFIGRIEKNWKKILCKGGGCGHRSSFYVHLEMSPLVFLGKCSDKTYKEVQ